MKKDTRSQSAFEACINTLSGYVLSVCFAHFIFPLMGIATTTKDNMLIVASFTVLSFVRSYLVRRLFVKYDLLNFLKNLIFKQKLVEIKIIKGVFPDDLGNLTITPYSLQEKQDDKANQK